MKEVFASHLGHTVKLGARLKPIADCPHLKLKHYLRADLAPPPVSTNYRAKAMASLRRMYRNDALGCCTVTAKAHLKGLVTGNADGGVPVQFTDAQIDAWYSAITGWNQNDPSTDRGANMQDVLNYFLKNGYGAGTQKPLGWVAVDLTNPTEVKQAAFLFEGADVGGDLPDTAITPFPSTDGEWDFSGAPDPDNGHDFPIIDYDAAGVYVATWALIMHIKWADFARIGSKTNGGEGYILVDPDMIAKASGKAPNGLALTELVTDFDKIYGGNVPVPAPPAPTPPAPTPPAPAPAPSSMMTLSLVQAQLFAIDKLHNSGVWLLSRTQAEKLVTDSLAMHWKP